MKKKIVGTITFLGVIVGIIASVPPIKEFFFPKKQLVTDLTNRDLLVKLFNADIITDNDLGRWRIDDLSDSISIIENEGRWLSHGYFYTKVEKVFRYKTLDNKMRAIVVFGTHALDDDGSIRYSHVEAPIISLAAFVMNADESWTNTRFSRHCLVNGTFGRMQGAELLKIGVDKLALYFTSVYVGTGAVECSKEIYDAEDFHKVFEYMCKVSYEGFFNTEKNTIDDAYNVNCDQIFDTTSQGEYYPFCLKYTGEFPADIKSLEEDYGINPYKNDCYAYNYASREYRIEKIPGQSDD